MPEPTPRQDEDFALAMAPVMRELMELVGGCLPPGTHFAILVEAQGDGAARVIAATTDRDRMVRRAGEWVLTALRPGHGRAP